MKAKIARIAAFAVILTILTSIGLFAFRRGVELSGAGATFPYPLYEKMFNDYSELTGVRVNYQAIGSGGGIRLLFEKRVDFGASDVAIDDELLMRRDADLLHIPICLGAVVLTYNLPGVNRIQLDADVIADIFLGEITRWNDPRLVKLNPQIKLPDTGIEVVHRSDNSGTTAIFSNYLTKVSTKWKERTGEGSSLHWLTGVGAPGNAGVAAKVKETTGAIGYVELKYAEINDMSYASIKNRAGNFIEPNIESVSLAANIAFPVDARVSLTDTDAAFGYPISGFTWIVIHREQRYNRRTKILAEETVKLIEWMIGEGQKHTAALHYAPLPEAAVNKAHTLLGTVTYNKKKLN